jgi:PAS domain S-box-containing protein
LAIDDRDTEALRASEERLRLMIEAVGDYAIFNLDTDGTIRTWNLGAERLKGYNAREILGQHFSVFYTDEDRARRHPESELERARVDGRYEEEGWRVRKDGTQFWANVVLTALFDREGRHVGFTKVTRDFTERRAALDSLRQSEERLRLLVESVKDYAIYMLDRNGCIATWNSGAENIKGYTAHEAIGRHFAMFYPPEDVAAGRPERELTLATRDGRYEEEGWRVRKNGERFWASVVITAVYDEARTITGFAKVTRDLTERRRIELQMLAAERAAAEERVRTMEAERLVEQRDEFISVAAHELRTPLTALQLKLQGLEQGLEKVVPDGRLLDRLRGALRQVGRLGELVERLLDVSRIVGGKLVLKRESTDVAALARQIADELREPARAAGVDLRLHGVESVVGQWDKARLEQVVTNLVSNAIKYGNSKPVDITIASTDALARVTVADHGIGIAADDLERIFGRFERAVPGRHYAGLGLGLYVSRNIVEAHGGTLQATSDADEGSTFVVEIPL